MVGACKHCVLPLHSNIQFAATENITQGTQLYQRTLVLLCCSHDHNALDCTEH